MTNFNKLCTQLFYRQSKLFTNHLGQLSELLKEVLMRLKTYSSCDLGRQAAESSSVCVYLYIILFLCEKDQNYSDFFSFSYVTKNLTGTCIILFL